MRGLSGLAVSVLVALAGVLAFAPRGLPPQPASTVPVEHMQLFDVSQTRAGLLAAGELGHIRLSADGGKSWHAAEVQPQRHATLTRVVFADGQQGLALGHEGLILLSNDGGRSWQERAFNAEGGDPLLDAARLPSGDWLVVGAFGRVLRSRDGGQSWQREAIEGLSDWHLNGIAGSADGQRWLIVGEAGSLLRSRDAGASWQALPAFYDGSLYGALSLGKERWLAYGMRGQVFRSLDDGETWQPLSLPEKLSVYRAELTAAGHLLLAGQGGALLLSQDDGDSFSLLREGQESITDLLLPPQGPWLLASDAGLRSFTPPMLNEVVQ